MRGRRHRRLVFAALLLLLVLAALELISFIGLRLFDRRNNLRTVRYPAERAVLLREIKRGQFRFDPELGWDEEEPVRGQRFYRPGRHYASSYGDSFTYCAELLSPAHTWQHQFEVRTGRPILNLGTNAYGTDQAYLKLQRYYPQYPTQVVLFGILPENISRLVSVVRKFYFSYDRAPLVKPRFQLQPDGSVRLLPSPARSLDDLFRLGDLAFLERAATHDFWYQLHKDRYGFDMIHGRGFPSLPEAGRLIVGLVRYPSGPVGYHTFYQQPDLEPYRLMQHLVRAFSAHARERGYTPIVVLHVAEPDIEGLAYLEPFIRFIRDEQHLTLLDVSALFREALAGGAPRASLYTGTHYSQRGNAVVAAGLERMLRSRGLLK